jgi:iron complex transport system substrate-binding protein
MAVRPLLAGALAGLVLLATACGGDDDDSSATTALASTTAAAATPTTAGATTTSSGAGSGNEPGAVPARIVSLSATATETLFAIGAGDQVVAVDDQSNYPAAAAAKMTELSGYTPNIEAVAGYDPDLVVISGDDKLKSQLEGLGLKVWVGESAKTFDEAYTQIEQLGAATGHVAEAAELVGQMQTDLAALAKDVPTSETALTVFHELDDTGYAAASNTFIGQVYELFGLSNIADTADDPSGYPQLSQEAIIEADPDLIFLADTKCCGQSLETLKARSGWADIAAVKAGHVFEMDDDIASRWGPRVVEYARQVHDALQQVAVPAG